MIVELLTEYHLDFLCFKGGYKGSSESTLVKMSNCWKSHAAAHLVFAIHTIIISCQSIHLLQSINIGGAQLLT